jgi:hypothetical protein
MLYRLISHKIYNFYLIILDISDNRILSRGGGKWNVLTNLCLSCLRIALRIVQEHTDGNISFLNLHFFQNSMGGEKPVLSPLCRRPPQYSVIKKAWMKWTKHVARSGKMRNKDVCLTNLQRRGHSMNQGSDVRITNTVKIESDRARRGTQDSTGSELGPVSRLLWTSRALEFTADQNSDCRQRRLYSKAAFWGSILGAI